MSTENRAVRAARGGAAAAIIAVVAAPAFALAAPAGAAASQATEPKTATTSGTAGAQTTGTPAAAVRAAVPRAAADDTVGQIAKGLIDSRLYVTSGAGNPLSQADRNEIETSLGGDSDADIRAVVVRNDVTGTEVRQLLPAVAERVGKGGTYVAITADGARMGAVSKKLDRAEINQMVTRTEGAPLKQRLIQFGGLAEKKVDSDSRSSATVGYVLLGVLVLVVAAITGVMLNARKKRRERAAREMADLKAGVQEDVTLLGEDIARLDLNVMDSGLDPDTRADYEQAMNSYDRAKSATGRAVRPQDMQEVATALEDGRYHMTATRARLAGDPVPERRAPCFFNPQHGPSVQDVTWAPPGGVARSVPACAADAEAVLHGNDPDVRMVPMGGGRQPYWNAGPAYAPYAGGYYYGYGGVDLLSGLLIGTALGSMWGGGFGGGFGGGDFGGGDGDIGGGWDFGGGDFGGGGGGGDFGGF
ncbi:hypothetical protein [Actinomadura citrea]|uniref:TPM domain-containing protein n=1 Tax=Actinomadura citrea TaxID=46158 RepID=A0A7Y9GIJ9_9ACTN|nr:hypothetical protein [Actinomadura citrea]NYE17134.1 hypothetical protein [Actinomadura citrea]